MASHIYYTPDILQGATTFKITATQFEFIYNMVVKAPLEVRLEMKGLKKMRAEMIVVAFILVRFILEKTGLEEINQSEYALKEGVLWWLLNN